MVSFKYGLKLDVGLELESSFSTCKASCMRKKLPGTDRDGPFHCRRRQWHSTPVLLPGKSHGWKSLVGCSPWDHEELDTTERLHF